MPQTLASFDASLKEWYEGQIRQVLNDQARLKKRLKKGSKKWEGRHVRFPAHLQRGWGVGFLTAGEALPAAGNEVTAEVQIPRRQLWGHIRITHDVINAARSDAGSFERPVAFETKRMTQNLIQQCNRSAWGEGDGKLGEVESYNAGTLTVTTSRMTDAAGSGLNGNADNRYIHAGMHVDIYSSAGAAHVQNATVDSVNIANGTFVISGGTITLNPAAGDGIYLARPSGTSPIDGEPMGVGGIIDDGTFVATLHNISRTTYPIWNSQVINAGTLAAPGSLTEDLLQRGFDLASEGGGRKITQMWAHYSVRRELLALTVTQRRYEKPYEYKAGFKEGQTDTDLETSLYFNEAPFLFDKHCPWRTIFMWDDEAVKLWESNEGEWVTDGRGGILTLVPGTAGLFQAQFAYYYNIGTDDTGPNSACVIRHIASTIDRVVAP